MKKTLLGVTVGMLAALPVFVNADEVGNAKFKECITSTEAKTCTLTESVSVGEQLEIAGNIKLELNGFTVSAAETLELKGGFLNVLHGGTLTIEDAKGTGKITVGDNEKVYSPLQLTKVDKTDITKTATLIVNGGHLEGNSYAICGNGNPDRINTKLVINGGKLSVKGKTGTAIFQPQDGETIVNGGEIKGATGIEIRSGKLEVNGGTIIGTSVPVEVHPNGSGTTSTGAGIAVAQHTTKLPIEVVIKGGTIQGYSALYQSNPQKNEAEAIAKIKITVKGGNLEAINEGTQVLYSENNLITVEAGEFSGELPENVTTPEDSKVYEVETADGKTQYVVATEEEVVETPFEADTMTGEELEKEMSEMEKMLEEIKEEELTEEELAEMKELEEFLTNMKKALDGKTIASAHDIYYGSFIGENYISNSIQTELKKAVEVTLKVPETLAKVKEGYTRKYSVVRLHWNEKTEKYEVSVLDAKENKDGTVTFETDKFSTYVLAYEDVKAATNPNTFDGISLYMIIASISLIGLVSLIAYSKKAKNY